MGSQGSRTSKPGASRPLDILFVTRSYFPEPGGGAEQQARLLACALVKRGHRVTVVCAGSSAKGSDESIDGVRVCRLMSPPGPSLARRGFHALALGAFLLRRLQRFDLVHIHALRFDGNLVLALAAILGRPAYLKLANGGSAGELAYWRRGWRRRLLMLRRARRVQAINDEIAAELAGAGVPHSRIVRLGNAVDNCIFHPVDAEVRAAQRRRLGLPEDDVIVLYTGIFDERKGLPLLIEAWRALAAARATLVLAGLRSGGKLVPGTHPAVVVREWTADITPYYQAADVFVLPSRAEGMSNSLLEALASGLAVIATRVGAAPTLIEDGVNGLLIEPDSLDELRSALALLVDKPELRSVLGANARRAVEELGVEHVVEELESVYLSMIAGRSN